MKDKSLQSRKIIWLQLKTNWKKSFTICMLRNIKQRSKNLGGSTQQHLETVLKSSPSNILIPAKYLFSHRSIKLLQMLQMMLKHFYCRNLDRLFKIKTKNSIQTISKIMKFLVLILKHM